MQQSVSQINFYTNFDSDYIYCGKVDLDWDVVEKDLNMFKEEQQFNLPSVDMPGLKQQNPELFAKQNKYKKYGYNKWNTKLWKTTHPGNTTRFDWETDITNQLPLDQAIVTVTRQDPGNVLPWHKDGYYYFKNNFPDDNRPVWRFLLFLNNWNPGQILQVNKSCYTCWEKGDVVVWQPSAMHLTANASLDIKWTANITGFLDL